MPKQRWDEARRREALRRSRIRSRMSSSSTYFYGTLMLVITTLALRGIAAAGPDYACKQAETTSGEGKLIPGSWVNDDFCDCPLGDDEPLTSACSSVTKTDARYLTFIHVNRYAPSSLSVCVYTCIYIIYIHTCLHKHTQLYLPAIHHGRAPTPPCVSCE